MDADPGRYRAKRRPDTAPKRQEAADVVVFGPFRLDSKRRLLTAEGGEVSLQPRAFDLLELLVSCRGQLLSNDEIVGHVWRGIAVGDNNLGVQLSALRRALAEHGGRDLIVTVPGRGYRFIGDVVHEPASAAPLADASPALPGARQLLRHVRRWRTGVAVAAALVLVGGLATLVRRPASPVARASAPAPAERFNPPPHSVAVLAFANLSNDPAADYLSDGLSEALIDALSRVNDLQVTARTSSFYFKGRAATIGDIARKLNVRSVLEGSLRRQGTHLRIDAHLGDANTGYQIWSRSYDLEMADMLKLQDEIADAVAEALQAKLLDTDAGRRSLGRTNNPQAFDAYLRAERHALETYDENMDVSFAKNDEAIAEFRKATNLDPDFARALIGLSGALSWKAGYVMSTADPAYRPMLEEARRAAEHAVAVAPALGLAHVQLGNVMRPGAVDLSAAWAEAVRAQALSPGDATVEEAYAQIAMEVGHRDGGIKAAARAAELDPLQAESWFTEMRVLTCARQYDAARDALQRGITLLGHPPSFAPYILGTLLLKQGKPEAARQTCVPTAGWTDLCLAIAYHALGRQKDAEANAQKMYADEGDQNSYNLAMVYAQWNQPEIAMHWLKKAREINDPGLTDIECDAWLDPIRGQPGFREIEQSLHLPPPD
jgi:TolB-like protein/DNA-binding winged helix-turn-helix (wHTH) protein